MAAEKGTLFVPATGRAFHSIPREILTLPGTEYVITSNGAAIYSVSRQKRIYQCLLRPESVEALLALETMEDRTARKQLRRSILQQVPGVYVTSSIGHYLPMLLAVKYGIAMGNADENCKRAAYAATKSNEEDGVGLCIMKMLEHL